MELTVCDTGATHKERGLPGCGDEEDNAASEEGQIETGGDLKGMMAVPVVLGVCLKRKLVRGRRGARGEVWSIALFEWVCGVDCAGLYDGVPILCRLRVWGCFVREWSS